MVQPSVGERSPRQTDSGESTIGSSGLISVIVPVYGQFDINRALLAVDSARGQRGVNVELVVSEQGEYPRIQNRIDLPVKYVFTYHKPSETLSDFNPGLVRNLGVKISSGEFLYTNDADVLLLNPNFLATLRDAVIANPNLALYRPPMRRLPIDCFDEFCRRVKSDGVDKAIKSLNLNQPFLAITDDRLRELKVVTRQRNEYEKTFTAFMGDFQRYLADVSLKGSEPLIWAEDRYAGGNFLRRKLFYDVGGYCERFVNWGCEDSDLQWKLGQRYNLQLFPKEQRFEVVHMDHTRGYFSREMWQRNEVICAERKAKGVQGAIDEDLSGVFRNGV